MKQCKSCLTENIESNKFCYECGKDDFGLMLCPHCGEKIGNHYIFCVNCGQRVKEAK